MGVALQRRVTRSSRSRHRPHIHETKPLPFHVNPIPDRQLPYHSHGAGPCRRNRGRRTGGNAKGKRNPSSTPCVRQNSFASDRLLRAEERMAGVARARGARADSKDTSSRPPSPRGRAEPRQTRQTRPSSPPASAPRPAPPRELRGPPRIQICIWVLHAYVRRPDPDPSLEGRGGGCRALRRRAATGQPTDGPRQSRVGGATPPLHSNRPSSDASSDERKEHNSRGRVRRRGRTGIRTGVSLTAYRRANRRMVHREKEGRRMAPDWPRAGATRFTAGCAGRARVGVLRSTSNIEETARALFCRSRRSSSRTA